MIDNLFILAIVIVVAYALGHWFLSHTTESSQSVHPTRDKDANPVINSRDSNTDCDESSRRDHTLTTDCGTKPDNSSCDSSSSSSIEHYSEVRTLDQKYSNDNSNTEEISQGSTDAVQLLSRPTNDNTSIEKHIDHKEFGVTSEYPNELQPAEALSNETTIPDNIDLRQSASREFLAELSKKRRSIDKSIQQDIERYSNEYQKKYAEDLETKRRLSSFAKENRLDRILIELWERVRYKKEGEYIESIGYVFDDRTLKPDGTEVISLSSQVEGFVIQRLQENSRSLDYDDDTISYLYYSLHQNSELKFAISCAETWGEWTNKISCFDVTAFKQDGTWAKQLLEIDRRLRIASEIQRLETKYFNAHQIRDRFRE